MFGLSPAQMIILLVVILLVFGTKKLEDFQPHFSLIIQPVLFAHETGIMK